MPTANYAVVVTANSASGFRTATVTNQTENGFRVTITSTETDGVANNGHSIVVHATNAQLPDTVTQEEIDWAVSSSVSAWGTTTVAGGLLNSLNISGMTNAVNGEYVYTFASPMPNNRYSISTAAFGGGSVPDATVTYKDQLPTGFTAVVCNGDGTKVNSAHSFTVHATNSVPPKGTTGADAWGVVNAGGGKEVPGYNFGSVNKTATGVYVVSFTTAMPSVQYAATATCALSNTNNSMISCGNFTTSGFTVRTKRDDVPHDIGFSFVVHATNAQLPNTVTQEQIDWAVGSSVSAWGGVNGNGTKGSGGLNFSSTRVSDGLYTITFADPMPSNTYAVTATPVRGSASDSEFNAHIENATATQFNVRIRSASASVDSAFYFMVHATNAPAPKGGTGADAWAFTSGAGNLSASYNFASCTVSSGEYAYVFSTPMPSQNYSVTATVSSADGDRNATVMNQTAAGFTVKVVDLDGAAQTQTHSVVVHATNATLPSPLTQDDLLFTDARNASTATQEFQDGLRVTGDHIVVNADKTGTARTVFGGGAIDTDTTDCRLFYSAPTFTGSGSIPYVNHFQAQPTRPTGDTTVTETTGFLAGANLSGSNVTTAYGFYADLGTNSNTNWNFYAAGLAPNWFQSHVISSGAIVCTPNDDDDWEINPPQAQAIGFSIRTSGNFLSYLGNNSGAFHTTRRQSNGDLHRFGSDANANLGAIRINSGALQFFDGSDYRLKQNIADLGSAVDQVKNLRPVSYEMKTDPGYTHVGFLAHEVQQVVPQAVLGDKDAVETVGTLTTAEGEVETNVPEPEAIPYGSTWEATGTRDDIQMMSKANLIPILTKALQETIAENEALKLRIEALESGELNDDATDSALLTLVANLSTRIAALEAG